ncbi:PKD domain-containing protein [Streptomyces sp. NPDC058525]|uniref:PKD domain-containing protein n=1 Tax=unclassified Streptomyces TaxID=2593676 RepID=UPI00364CC343
MRNRRLVVSAALVAAGIGLIPGTAQATGPVAPAGQGPAAFAAAQGKAGGQGKGEAVRSGADRTVVTSKADAAGNPDLAIELEAYANSAHEILLFSNVKSAAAALDITVDWGDGTTDKYAASGADVQYQTHMYAEVGTYKVKVTVKDTTNNVTAVNEVQFVTAGSEFTPHAPTRLLDTREGVGAAKAKVGAKGAVALKVGGSAKIPADVAAVALNVTVTSATDAGHIAVQPGKDFLPPKTSNLNYVAGQTVPNLVIVPVVDGYVHLVNGGWGPVDLIADVTGYFTRSAASGYAPLTPVRAVDTREGLGTAKGQVAGYGTFGVEVAGRHGIPKGATAVSLNLTATNPREAGHLTAFPSGQAAPSTSSVNFSAGQTVANSVIVPVGADGKISVRNGSWKGTDVVIDVVGYYSPESNAAFRPADEPFRFIDTREDAWYRTAGPVPAREYLPLPLMGDSAEPVTAWVLNATVTNTRGAGHLSVAPDPNTWTDYQKGQQVRPERPGSSSLNWTAGATVPNLVQTSGGKGDVIDFWNQGWEPVDVIVDCLGYYDTK